MLAWAPIKAEFVATSIYPQELMDLLKLDTELTF